MVIPGVLAIVGMLLLVAQSVFGGALNAAADDGPLVFVPLALGLICLATGVVLGMTRGPAVRWFVLLAIGGLALLESVVAAPGRTGGQTSDVALPLAVSAALLVLAITQGIRAFMDEQTAPLGDSSTK